MVAQKDHQRALGQPGPVQCHHNASDLLVHVADLAVVGPANQPGGVLQGLPGRGHVPGLIGGFEIGELAEPRLDLGEVGLAAV